MQTVVLDSPAELLASLSIQPVNHHQLLFISGQRGAGKTSWCQQLVELARNRGLEVAGLVSPAFFVDRRKVQIDLMDLETSVRRCLAVRKGEKKYSLLYGAWEFDPDVVNWGNARLGAIQHCQLLVLDELGPLEFEHQAGFTNAFALIDSFRYQLACVVIRPELLPQALERWPGADVMELPARKDAG